MVRLYNDVDNWIVVGSIGNRK